MKVLIILSVFLVGTTNSAPTSDERPEEAGFYQGDIVGVSPYLQSTLRSGFTYTYYRWPNRVVPYMFDENYPQDLRRTFEWAAGHINNSTCIKIVPRRSQMHYVRVFAGRGCYAYVGRIGYGQDISLPRACQAGTFVHELIHSLGFFHEHSRLDRDDYVRINWNNIPAQLHYAFEKAPGTTSFGVEYDFDSIMHYPRNAFTINGQDTITTIPAGRSIGQRIGMSQKDIAKINKMYNC